VRKEIEIGDTSVEMFNKLIRGSYPITLFTGVTYTPREHGQPSVNMPLQNDRDYLFETNGNRDLQSILNSLQLKKGEVFAIGSLVLVAPRGAVMNSQDMSFLMMDFDCKKDPIVLKEIISIVKSAYRNGPFSIVESDNSYHLVFDDIIKPVNLTWHLGKLIQIFSSLELNNKQQSSREFGMDLQKYYKLPNEIRRISNQALESFNHDDEISDKRWVSHTLIELMNYLMQFQELSLNYPYSFGFIRATAKSCFDPRVIHRQGYHY